MIADMKTMDVKKFINVEEKRHLVLFGHQKTDIFGQNLNKKHLWATVSVFSQSLALV